MSRRPPAAEQQNNGRNEYIPSFIAQTPFFAKGLSDEDYLAHQRSNNEPKDTLDKAKWYERGRKVGPAATKYRKGACENCGAITHKTKECLSRPRKMGAKWTGKDIQADEIVNEVQLGWDAKRDRWNGYDSREYSAVIKEHEELEAMRQAAKQSDANGGEGTEDANGDHYAEETDMGRSQPTSTRQLRLREDTAKYLVNLDLDSAKYDPKTRSMATTDPNTESANGEFDGFIRPTDSSSDAAAFEKAQKYAWESQESNIPSSAKLHLEANPTEAALLVKNRETETATKKEAQRAYLLNKYGTTTPSSHQSDRLSSSQKNGAISNKPPPSLLTSSERYVEYDSQGNPKPAFAALKTIARSKYPEDIHPNNHTSVFGSYWSDFQWGYACCHSTVRNSYCTGEEGKAAFMEEKGLKTGKTLLRIEQNEHATQNGNTSTATNGTETGTETDSIPKVSREEAEKLRLEQEGADIESRKDEETTDTTKASSSDRHAEQDDEQQLTYKKSQKKRTHAESMQYFNGGVTEEEMESYKRNKMAAEDPMAQLGTLNADGVLER